LTAGYVQPHNGMQLDRQHLWCLQLRHIKSSFLPYVCYCFSCLLAPQTQLILAITTTGTVKSQHTLTWDALYIASWSKFSRWIDLITQLIACIACRYIDAVRFRSIIVAVVVVVQRWTVFASRRLRLVQESNWSLENRRTASSCSSSSMQKLLCVMDSEQIRHYVLVPGV